MGEFIQKGGKKGKRELGKKRKMDQNEKKGR
jgi:hypothetical protein